MRIFSLIVVSAVCLGFAGPAGAADEDLLGTWIVKEQTRGPERVYTLTIAASGGTWAGEGGSSELSDFKIEDGRVTFSRSVNRRGQESSIEYSASIVDGNLLGTLASAQGESEFRAQRMPEPERLAIEARKAAISQLEPCSVLAVFAHPDDETFATGTFAKLSAKGECVQLVYTTSGDAGGDQSGRGLSGAELAEEREREMHNAADVLEVSTEPLFLRYPDGQVYERWNEVLRNVQSIIEKTRPSVVVTFGPDGYYGHADHLAIGQIAERAFDDSGTPSHLLHVAISRSKNDVIVKAGGGSRYKPVADKFITYTVNVRKQLKQRVAAMEAHRTQFDDRTVVQYRLLASMTGTEEFVEVRHPGETGTLLDLFSD